jgi:hypothetical protein
MPQVIKTLLTRCIRTGFTNKDYIPFGRRRQVTCGRKEKQENEIGQNLSLEKRKKDKMRARRRNWPEMKGNNPDKRR